MFPRLSRALTVSAVILVLLAFSGAKGAEILYPLEQASEAAEHHRHAEPVLEIPHLHYVHMCAHDHKLGVVAELPPEIPLVAAFLGTIRRDTYDGSPPPSSSLARGPPGFAIS